VTVVQSAPASHPTLRPHRIGVGVYSGGLLTRRVDVDLDPARDGGRTAVAELVGAEAGELLLLNDGDLTYAKVRFDPRSRAVLPSVLPTLADPLARALVWAAVADAVRDAEYPATEFIRVCAAALPEESELTIFRDVVRFAATTVVDQYLEPADRTVAGSALAGASRDALAAAEPGSGRQLLAARALVTFAGAAEVAELRSWLDGTGPPKGLRVDTELRWTVLYRLAGLGAAGLDEIDAEYARDHTAPGAEHAARCRAARPDPAAKADAWRVIATDDSVSNRLMMATAEGFWQYGQDELNRSYVERYFAEMPAMARRRTPQIVVGVSTAAFPRFAVRPETVAAAHRMLADPDLSPSLRRVVVDLTDELRRALLARAGSSHAAAP
jgi:aminopeptidase N